MLRQSDYRDWAKREREKPVPRLRAPLRVDCCARRIGGWLAVLTRLGVDHRSSLSVRNRDPVAGARLYTDDHMLEVLKDAAAEHSPRLPLNAYRSYVERRNQQARAENRARVAPHHLTIINRFGTWRNAKAAAGLPIGPVGSDRTGPRTDVGRFYTDEELERSVIDAMAELGREMGSDAYRDRRRELVRHARSAGEPQPRIANILTVRRLADGGTFADARRVVLARHPELLDDQVAA